MNEALFATFRNALRLASSDLWDIVANILLGREYQGSNTSEVHYSMILTCNERVKRVYDGLSAVPHQ